MQKLLKLILWGQNIVNLEFFKMTAWILFLNIMSPDLKDQLDRRNLKDHLKTDGKEKVFYVFFISHTC